MVAVDLKALIGRLNRSCKRALETAAGICVSRGNYEVTVEHVFQALLEDSGADVQQILTHYEVDAGRVMKALVAHLDKLRAGNTGRPVFSPVLMEWVQAAWVIGSIEYSLAEVRSGNLLQAMIDNPGRLAAGDFIDLITDKVPGDDLKRNYAKVVVNSKEEAAFASAAAPSGGPAGVGPEAGGEGTAIAKFCVHFTGRAREGLIDPVFGRDREIRQMVDILARRRKNNPIAVGEAGVGKTALIEGLALRMAEGDVPNILQGVELYGLDMGALQAGASMKGEFEKRLKAVIEEVKSSPKPIIMFIDEAHTLIGAGGAAGSGDAANLLKPALARGELRTIAATTWSEYKKYFEKDPALARRFQLVKVEEPSDDDTVTMLRGLKDKYEAAHGVTIRDDALEAAAKMGSRYIAGRQQPDKGVDLMDTAAARVKIALTSKPPHVDDGERRIQTLNRELAAHQRDKADGATDRDERIGELEAELERLEAQVEADTARWRREQEAASKVVELRKALAQAKLGEAPEGETPGDPEALRGELDAAQQALLELQGDSPLIPLDVTADVVANVIADWTGIPMSNMVQDEAATLLAYEEKMKERVVGQDHAHQIVGTGIRAAKSGLKDPNTPIGVFLFVGPSGVGKTETALGVADLLFGGERFMTTINMSEFQEKHTVSRLIGSPPGYVGYGEGGLLTEAVRQRPYSVVLLDEVEKADLDVMNLFYQVFDKGSLTDGEGIEVNFKETVIFLTSNLATDIITEAGTGDEPVDLETLVSLIRPVLSAHFKPALLARMTIVPFYPLLQDALKGIARLKLNKLVKRLKEAHRMELVIDEAVVTAIAERCTEVETGARNVDHIIRGTLLPQMSTQLLEQMSVGDLPPKMHVGFDGDQFTFGFSE